MRDQLSLELGKKRIGRKVLPNKTLKYIAEKASRGCRKGTFVVVQKLEKDIVDKLTKAHFKDHTNPEQSIDVARKKWEEAKKNMLMFIEASKEFDVERILSETLDNKPSNDMYEHLEKFAKDLLCESNLEGSEENIRKIVHAFITSSSKEAEDLFAAGINLHNRELATPKQMEDIGKLLEPFNITMNGLTNKPKIIKLNNDKKCDLSKKLKIDGLSNNEDKINSFELPDIKINSFIMKLIRDLALKLLKQMYPSLYPNPNANPKWEDYMVGQILKRLEKFEYNSAIADDGDSILRYLQKNINIKEEDLPGREKLEKDEIRFGEMLTKLVNKDNHG